MANSLKPSMLVEQKRLEAMLKNKHVTVYWEERKKSYEKVSKSLAHYVGKLQENIMVPIGKRGLMRGQIVNTNQVFVSLGDGWFTKVCSEEAQKVCSRKISECSSMLDKLEKERKLFEGWTAISKEQVFGTEDTKEIIEPYDEKEEETWREQHTEKVRQHRKKLSEVHQKLDLSRSKDKNTEEELWRHLELLEMQEEFEDELDRLDEYQEDSDTSSTSSLDSDDDSTEEILEKVTGPIVKENNLAINTSNVTTVTHPIIKNINQKNKDSKVIVNDKGKTVTKKVTFDTNITEKYQNNLENSNAIQQMQTVQIGQIIERSSNSNTCQNISGESRPVSKFKSSKQQRLK